MSSFVRAFLLDYSFYIIASYTSLIFIQRDYEEFKVRINALVAKAQKVPEEGWTMQDGSPWPGNNVRDHPGMIQVMLLQFWCFTTHVRFFFLCYFSSKCSIFYVNRSSLAKVVAVMWKEMSFLAWFMSQEKRGQAIIIIRRLVLWMHW